MDESGRLGEPLGEHPPAAADLEHDIFGRQLGEPLDHIEDVAIDEKILAELWGPTDSYHP